MAVDLCICICVSYFVRYIFFFFHAPFLSFSYFILLYCNRFYSEATSVAWRIYMRGVHFNLNACEVTTVCICVPVIALDLAAMRTSCEEETLYEKAIVTGSYKYIDMYESGILH